MRNVVMSVVVLVGAPAWAERADPIDRVVVFGDRAQVTRTTEVRCDGGTARATFGPLPAALVERTLRGGAAAPAVAVGVTATRGAKAAEDDAWRGPLDAENERLDAALRALERQVAQTRAEGEDAARFRQLLVQLVGREARAARPETARWGEALDRLRAGELARADTLRDLAEQQAGLQRERALVVRQRSRLASADVDEAYTVQVAVDCAKRDRARVTLSYVVPGATWRPEYDLRFRPKKGEVGPGEATLGVGAVVQQATGEDWKDVTLVLSSARPWLGVEAPTPAALRVGGDAGPSGKVLVQAREERVRLDRTPTGAAAAGPTGAALNDQGQAVTLTLPHRTAIASDGRPYWSPIDRITARAEAHRVAVPKRSPHVFQVVRLKNPAPYPLLAGRLHTWRGGTFVGTQSLEHTGPGAPLEVSLGTDGAFRVTREVLEDRTREPGFLGSTRTLPRAYALIVRSTAGAPATIEVQENIPVSKVAEVKVELSKKTTTAGYALDPLTGLLTWPVEVKPGGDATVKVGYRIQLPDDWKVN